MTAGPVVAAGAASAAQPVEPPRRGPAPAPVQTTFDDLGTPLRDLTFVVVDLETTGGSPASAGITEIGAVKVRGGERLGEFHTLVDPGEPIPPFIQVLTGITDATVAGAPRIGAVLPSFLEFAGGSVLVAHNAPFDVGFLKAACARRALEWPGFPVLDTARLARRVLTRDDAPNCKLATLARLFRAEVAPSHRALDDARATVDVLHGLFERLGCEGVTTWDEVATYSSRVSPAQRRKRHLADGLPTGPGVYLFRDGRGRVLYVGKSTSVRARVRQYFTASETRTRMSEMVGIAEEVVAIGCATALEAEVRELRLIAEHKPRYNRRSRFPEKAVWLKLTAEPFPRLSTVRQVRDDGVPYLGPFGSARAAELAATALLEALPLRQCSARLSPRRSTAACVLAELGRCGAPCDGRQSVDDYAALVERARQAITGDPSAVVAAARRRITPLTVEERFEEAAVHRDRMVAFLRAAARGQRLAALARCAEVVAARPASGGYDLAVVRHGRLAAAGHAAAGVDPRPVVDALRASAEHVPVPPPPTPACSAEEAECVLRWLDDAGTRLVEVDGVWASPASGAGRFAELLRDRRAADWSGDDRRGLRPLR